MSNEQDLNDQKMQDPLIAPDYLKQMAKALSGKAKHVHPYEYRDTQDFDLEIDEFFNYAKVASDLQACRHDSTDSHGPLWRKRSIREREEEVKSLLNQLEYTEQDQRLIALEHLLLISLGDIKGTMVLPLLSRIGAISVFFQALKRSYASLHALDQGQTDQIVLENTIKEVNQLQSLLYILIEYCRQEKMFSSGQVRLDSGFLEFLFKEITTLKEKYIRSSLVKKLVLLLWKTVLVYFGGSKQLKETRERMRKQYGLCRDGHDPVTKCYPEDFYRFQEEMVEKYSAFSTPKVPDIISNPRSIKTTPELSEAMGVSAAINQTTLPYQTLFPPKQNPVNPEENQEGVSEQQEKPSSPKGPTTISLPVTENGPSFPKSLKEAGEIYLKNLHISLADYQMIHEREEAINRWQALKSLKGRSDEGTPNGSLQDAVEDRVEEIYSYIAPHLQTIVIVFLKLLLLSINPTKPEDRSEPPTVEEADVVRDKEITAKAVSATLWLLLKWFKLSHVLKYEYFSQLLVDSGSMLLILKILGLQEITSVVATKSDVDQYSLLTHLGVQRDDDEQQDNGIYTSQRNMFWTINLLRVLQMLSKRKTARILLLVQYKSSAILKRVLKIKNPTMELYTLKIIQSQTRFLGRRWRYLNMKTVSAIYMRNQPLLRDDWLVTVDSEKELEAADAQEKHLRVLVQLYHGQRYLPEMLPPADDHTNTEGGIFSLARRGNREDYSLDGPMSMTEVELAPDFEETCYRWVQEELESTDEIEVDTRDAWAIGTPVPSKNEPISPRLLAAEINKLYREELEQEFKVEAPVVVEDGWDAPALVGPTITSTTAKIKAKYAGNTHDDYENDSDSDEEVQDDDPLGDINWETLTEKDLVDRLTKVEENTSRRWLNIDINDPSYLKVLNTFEGESLEEPIPDDDWIITPDEALGNSAEDGYSAVDDDDDTWGDPAHSVQQQDFEQGNTWNNPPSIDDSWSTTSKSNENWG
ncbi:hypothetical protein CLU79DRAFT_725928 [Phycomyces nitens]|nr:hypothetical protein CLU79DRAFT_725928 [Phycomyces nitens]